MKKNILFSSLIPHSGCGEEIVPVGGFENPVGNAFQAIAIADGAKRQLKRR
jgi:hypothetical protein